MGIVSTPANKADELQNAVVLPEILFIIIFRKIKVF